MIVGHEVTTVPQAGWAGLKNGDLLRRAREGYDIFVTVDRNLAFQQNLPSLNIAVFILVAATNRLRDLAPLVPKLLATLPIAQRGTITEIS